MNEDIAYSQQRSLNLGVALDTSVEAALMYNDLAYAQAAFGEGYFFRSDEQMIKRFPMWSKNTIRRHVALLAERGWISTKVEKVGAAPKLHYQIEKVLLPKMGKSIEIPKMGKSLLVTKKETKTDTRSLLSELIILVNPKEKPTADRVRVLNGRLADYTPAEIIAAAKAFSKSEWHRDNHQMKIDNLLAPSKFGRWFDEGQKDAPKGDNGTDVAASPEQQRALIMKREEEAQIKLAKERGDYDGPK